MQHERVFVDVPIDSSMLVTAGDALPELHEPSHKSHVRVQSHSWS